MPFASSTDDHIGSLVEEQLGLRKWHVMCACTCSTHVFWTPVIWLLGFKMSPWNIQSFCPYVAYILTGKKYMMHVVTQMTQIMLSAMNWKCIKLWESTTGELSLPHRVKTDFPKEVSCEVWQGRPCSGSSNLEAFRKAAALEENTINKLHRITADRV